MEYVSPEGLRGDGRRVTELRKVTVEIGVMDRPDGSASLRMGNTLVIASVFGPREPLGHGGSKHDRSMINCEFSTAPFSAAERRDRFKGDRRSTEMANLVAQSFECIVLSGLYPYSEIDIFIQVLQADGGVLATAINAATLALIDAGVAMKDFVVACEVMHIEKQAVLDPNEAEESSRQASVLFAYAPNEDRVTMVRTTPELIAGDFEMLLSAAKAGSIALFDVLRAQLSAQTSQLVQSAGLVTSSEGGL